MWVTTTALPTTASHPFYALLNQWLRDREFDDFAEGQCATFYAEAMGRRSESVKDSIGYEWNRELHHTTRQAR